MTTAVIMVEHDAETGAVDITVSGAGEALNVADHIMSVASAIQGDNLIEIQTLETH